MKKTFFIFLIFLLFLIGNSLIIEKNAVGAIINFETVPGGVPSDGLVINTQYQALINGGVTFSTTLGDPRLEDVGGGPQDMPGFINDNLNLKDTEATGIPQSLGNFFLRLGTGNLQAGTVPTLIIDYTTPVSAASAQIWDIDAFPALGYEQWEVTAYDQAGGNLATVVSPQGLDWSDPNSLDGKPWTWAFDLGTGNMNIWSIEIEWLGSKTSGIGLAFDNFNTTTAVPIPGAIWLFGSGILGMVFMRRRFKN